MEIIQSAVITLLLLLFLSEADTLIPYFLYFTSLGKVSQLHQISNDYLPDHNSLADAVCM